MKDFFKRNSCIVALSAAFLLASPLYAHAYIDWGTGSFIIQGVLSAVFGAALGIRIYWRKIKKFFGPASVSKDEKNNNKEERPSI